MPLFRRRHQPHSPPWDAATADEELVARAQAGDREAFGALYDRYLPRVYGYCYRLLGAREAAEDANTEVFPRALAGVPGRLAPFPDSYHCPNSASSAREMLIMATVTRISEQEYRELALNDPNRAWELWDGMPVEKPAMSAMHDDVAFQLGLRLQLQLDPSVYRINVNGGKARYTARNFLIPDVVVLPAALVLPFRQNPRAFNAHPEPLPLVVEIWSLSTGDYDIEAKLPIYRERGDREIWFIHPYERTLTAWRRQPDCSYLEARYTGGIVAALSLPGVSFDLDALLDG